MKRKPEDHASVDEFLKQGMDSDVPPEVERRLRQHLAAFRERLESRLGKRRGLRLVLTWPRLAIVGGTGLVILVVLMLILLSGTDPATRLYAAAMKALKTVRTMHVTGWQSSIRKGHSSVLDEPPGPSKRYAVDMWEWTAEDGRHRRYERVGAITFWDDAERRYEYHKDTDTLYVAKSRTPQIFDILKLQVLESPKQLKALAKAGMKKTGLGERRINRAIAKGVRLEKPGFRRTECWFDVETALPVEVSLSRWENGAWVQARHYAMTYNQQVPAAISGYTSPRAKRTEYDDWQIDPRFEKCHRRVRWLKARYAKTPLVGKMELVPYDKSPSRDDPTVPYGYTIRIHGGKDACSVRPMRGKLGSVLRSYAFMPRGSLRVPAEVRDIRMNHDLVTRKGPGTKEEVFMFVLDFLALELTEVTEERTVWVAKYDGRKLKFWREVKAPVPNPDHKPFRPGTASMGGAHSMRELLNGVVWWQDYDLTARGIVIIDKTGLPARARDPKSIAVSSESPYWGSGPEGMVLAKRWFRDEFGVTFTEETRPMTVYVVRRRRGK